MLTAMSCRCASGCRGWRRQHGSIAGQRGLSREKASLGRCGAPSAGRLPPRRPPLPRQAPPPPPAAAPVPGPRPRRWPLSPPPAVVPAAAAAPTAVATLAADGRPPGRLRSRRRPWPRLPPLAPSPPLAATPAAATAPASGCSSRRWRRHRCWPPSPLPVPPQPSPPPPSLTAALAGGQRRRSRRVCRRQRGGPSVAVGGWWRRSVLGRVVRGRRIWVGRRKCLGDGGEAAAGREGRGGVGKQYLWGGRRWTRESA